MSFPRIEGYVVTEKIGSGSYSTVYKAYNKVGGRQTVAIKCVEKSRVKHSGAAVDNLISEIRLLKTLEHPHIVRMYDFTWDDKNIYIIMEYCSGGDLSRYIRRCGRVPETQVQYFLQQLAAALKYLHEKGVAHMDLKPHNLLLHKDAAGHRTLKLADFGFAAHVRGGAEGAAGGVRGSPLYMAPEVLAAAGAGAGAAPAADLWSVGVILYECLFGRAPYCSSTLAELLHKIHRQEPVQIPARAAISAPCRDLLRSLLHHDPAQRITYDQFFQHEFLDLEHMPTPENYQKAVSLINSAVQLDARGEHERALLAYTGALRYLVPHARAHRDPASRAALTHKLTRYMDRAEEIKQYLKSGRTQPTDVVPGQMEVVPEQMQVLPGQTEEYPGQTEVDPGQTEADPGKTEADPGHTDAVSGNTEEHKCSGNDETQSKDAVTWEGGARRGLHRLLSLRRDSAAAGAPSERRHPADTDTDACKIT